MNILVIEDDPGTGQRLYKGLSRARHSCVLVKQARRGVERARKQHDDAIVLSLSLAEPALRTLERIRALGIRTPVIALASNGAVEERIAALKAGADDCMAKPIATAELLARLEAVRRRTLDRPEQVLRAGKLTLNLANRRLSCQRREMKLTPAEFRLAELLFRRPGKVVDRAALVEHHQRSARSQSRNVVEVHLSRLRNKLREVSKKFAIATIRKKGYVLQSISDG